MQVYVNKDGQQSGPFTVEQLRQHVQQGNFTTSDHACHDGQDWVTIAEVPGFAAGGDSVTTPQQDQATQEKAVKQQPASADASSSPSKKKNVILWSSIGGGVLVVAALLTWLLVGDKASPESNQSPTDPPDAKPAQVAKIDLDDTKVLDQIIAKAIGWTKLQRRGKKGDEVCYAVNQETPYSGWRKRMWGNGQIRELIQYKDGKADGMWMSWYNNGHKRRERTYKDGELMTIVDWKPDGEKCPDSKLVIITRTGNEKNAGTDGMVMHAHVIGPDIGPDEPGDLGPMDNIGINDKEAGSTDIYSLPFNHPVSEIQGVELVVVKGNDAWRVESISFQSFDGGKKSKTYAFEVNQWFSAEKKDLDTIGAIKSKMFSFRPEVE